MKTYQISQGKPAKQQDKIENGTTSWIKVKWIASNAYHDNVIFLIDIHQAVNQSNAFVAPFWDDNNPFTLSTLDAVINPFKAVSHHIFITAQNF